ncbi:hypothetical protein BV898_19789 [Hypsibius exemplaris]|uniref:Uncharacterized protein n=1 Tax=Hypsibius exemplaris TaxID=2072580 RepID=A0A9X6NM80_HYPEX|nr:hypothetical protein BV898_19789 [Hypsibius exemplaris]
MIPEIHAIEAQGCQCQNKKLLGSPDLSKYTQCEKVADKPSPRKVTCEVFAMKKASVFFPATLCKATVQSITVTKFFWGSTDSVPSSSFRDLSPDECQRMYQSLNCFSNQMRRVPGTNAFAFTEQPEAVRSWLTTTTTTTSTVSLNPRNSLSRKQEETSLVLPALWGQRKKWDNASKGGMTFIWQTEASDQKKPCDYESITKNDGYLYDLENKRLRVRDPERQVDFILDAQPAVCISSKLPTCGFEAYSSGPVTSDCVSYVCHIGVGSTFRFSGRL